MTKCKVCAIPIWEYDGVVENGIVRVYRADGELVPLYDDPDAYGISFESAWSVGFVQVNGKWGYMYLDSSEIFVEPIWDYVEEFIDGLAVVGVGNEPMTCQDILFGDYGSGGIYGCVDFNGKLVIPAEYGSLYVRRYHDVGVLLARKDGLTGILDREGNTVLPFKYDYVYFVGTDCLLCEEKNSKYSFLYNEKTVFTDVDRIYVPDYDGYKRYLGGRRIFPAPDIENKKLYYIACKGKNCAVFCSDGRIIEDFSLQLYEAKKIVKKLCGNVKNPHYWVIG